MGINAEYMGRKSENSRGTPKTSKLNSQT